MTDPTPAGREGVVNGAGVWHDEADRSAVWGCLDPTDACMCRDCVLGPTVVENGATDE